MTVKAGQKCTAIRRAMAPAEHLDAVQRRSPSGSPATKVGDPRAEDTRMGALVSRRPARRRSRQDRRAGSAGARIVAGDPRADPPVSGGAFLPPILLRSDDPWRAPAVHDVEPFGPVSTIMPYRDLDDAIALANRGKGSLALSLFTHSPRRARDFVLGQRPLSRPDAGHRPHQRTRNRPATARRCPCSSMAARAAPAAARRWAASAA